MKNKKNLWKIIVLSIVTAIFVFVLCLNLTLIFKGIADKENPPSIFGHAPLTVVSDSMHGNNPNSFDKGDLVFIKILSNNEKNQLKQGNIVCYKGDNCFITHRIISITYKDAECTQIDKVETQGDANNYPDTPISVELILGKYTSHMKAFGNFIVFMQKPTGLLLFIGLPVAIIVAYYFIKNKMELKKLLSQTSSSNQNQKLDVNHTDEEIQEKEDVEKTNHEK